MMNSVIITSFKELKRYREMKEITIIEEKLCKGIGDDVCMKITFKYNEEEF